MLGRRVLARTTTTARALPKKRPRVPGKAHTVDLREGPSGRMAVPIIAPFRQPRCKHDRDHSVVRHGNGWVCVGCLDPEYLVRFPNRASRRQHA
jgi:hypothetical protein